MSKTVKARLESILKKIDDIEFIVERHSGISNALRDREGQPAILMLIEAIAEQISKIEDIIERGILANCYKTLDWTGANLLDAVDITIKYSFFASEPYLLKKAVACAEDRLIYRTVILKV